MVRHCPLRTTRASAAGDNERAARTALAGRTARADGFRNANAQHRTVARLMRNSAAL
jgi:hypothetical protein